MNTTTTTMTVTGGSDPTRYGQRVNVHTANGQACVTAPDGQTIVPWSADVRWGSYNTTVRKTPGWAVALGVLGLLFFLIGIVFFFVKEDVVVPHTTMTIVDGATWVTLA